MIRPKVKWKMPLSQQKTSNQHFASRLIMKKLSLITLVNVSLFLVTVVHATNNEKETYVPLPGNTTGINITQLTSEMPPVMKVRCDAARIKCALRRGCSSALQGYMLDCADLMAGRVTNCDEFCEASLIALTSNEEGEALMNCVCTDDYCSRSKARIEVCRKGVILAKGKDAVVSCSVAHLICTADTSCSTALSYYDRFCKRMFIGRECSYRCNNSISILERQEKAAKLESCVCDGTEGFDCFGIKKNMKNLCFPQPSEPEVEKKEEETNEIASSSDKDRKDAVSNVASVLNRPVGLPQVTIVTLSSSLIVVGLVSSIVVRWSL